MPNSILLSVAVSQRPDACLVCTHAGDEHRGVCLGAPLTTQGNICWPSFGYGAASAEPFTSVCSPPHGPLIFAHGSICPAGKAGYGPACGIPRAWIGIRNAAPSDKNWCEIAKVASNSSSSQGCSSQDCSKCKQCGEGTCNKELRYRQARRLHGLQGSCSSSQDSNSSRNPSSSSSIQRSSSRLQCSVKYCAEPTR